MLRACSRCKRRKRKCDGLNPCQSCINSSSECEYLEQQLLPQHQQAPHDHQLLPYPSLPLNPPAGMEVEVNRIKFEFESKIQKLYSEHNAVLLRVQAENRMLTTRNHQLNEAIMGLKAQNNNGNNAKERSSQNDHDTNGMLSESVFSDILLKLFYRSTNESQEYIGTFAVINVVKAIKKNLLGDDYDPEHHAIILEDVVDDNASIPASIEYGFIEKFFSLSHNRYYLLDHIWFFNMLKQPEESRSEWEKFCHNIALGIGCRLNELLHVTTYPAPEVYLRRALKHLVKADMDEIKQIQGCMLMAVFISRSYHLSFYVSAWELVGLAMRKLVQYGFHRRQPLNRLRSWDYEFMKRLFWSTYNCDKLLSLSLGRPFSTFDSFIDIPYPLSIELSKTPTKEEFDRLYELQVKQHMEPNFKQDISEFTTFVNTSIVRQIESRIHLLLYSVGSAVPVADTFEGLLNELNEWYASLPSREEFVSVMNGREGYEFLDLLYHRARLILLLPRIMSRTDHERNTLLDQACLSAGGVCSSYKELYRASILEFSLVALHTVFLAGITMVYYLKNKGEPEFMDIQNDIRACSSLLFVFSERWTEAKTYSDLFDKILTDLNKKKRPIDEGVELLNSLKSNDGNFNSPLVQSSGSNHEMPLFSLNEDFWDHILQDIKTSQS